jgi:3-hydroxyisobutyrate dehydrogenase-like beta-hydroxyacid dehydrogenase
MPVMTTVAIVSPGFMGAGLGWALREGGARVVATLERRSARTRGLAEQAGLELLPTLADVLAAADIVLSVTPPGQALAAAQQIAAAARQRHAHPLVADLNAVAPSTMALVAQALSSADLDVVDGSISGPPPTAQPGARVYFSGPRAGEVSGLPWAGAVVPVVLGPAIGTASALKMCTASVYKGMNALLTQALRTAAEHGVLAAVLADLNASGVGGVNGVATGATKAHRYVDEMREIAATQGAAGLTPELFEAFAEVYAQIATTALAEGDPESARALTPDEIVDRLALRRQVVEG